MELITNTTSQVIDFVHHNASVRNVSSTLACLAGLAYWNESRQRVRPVSNPNSLKKVRVPSISRRWTPARSPRSPQPFSTMRGNGIMKRRRSGQSKFGRSGPIYEPIRENGSFPKPVKRVNAKYRRADGLPCFTEGQRTQNPNLPRRPPHDFHPFNHRYAKYLAAVTNALKEYVSGDLEPGQCGKNARDIRMITSELEVPKVKLSLPTELKQLNLQSPFSADKPTFTGFGPSWQLESAITAIQPDGQSNESKTLFRNKFKSTGNESVAPETSCHYPSPPKSSPRETAAPSPGRKGPWTRSDTKAFGPSKYVAPTTRRRSKSHRNLGALPPGRPPLPPAKTMSGALAPGDEAASLRLRARIGPESNTESLCNGDIQTQHTFQPWSLVDQGQLLNLIPWTDQILMESFIPLNFYTTFNVVALMLKSLVEEGPRTDEVILDTLLGFGAQMNYPFIDVEYMEPYIRHEEFTEHMWEYWTAHTQWVERSLQGLGVELLENGQFYTAGERYYASKGVRMELPGDVAEKKRKKELEELVGAVCWW